MKIRIVAAVIHNDTQELEVILETTKGDDSPFEFSPILISNWIDAESLLPKEEK